MDSLNLEDLRDSKRIWQEIRIQKKDNSLQTYSEFMQWKTIKMFVEKQYNCHRFVFYACIGLMVSPKLIIPRIDSIIDLNDSAIRDIKANKKISITNFHYFECKTYSCRSI